jgi:hypothetical protein
MNLRQPGNRNERRVQYDFIPPGARGGNCLALADSPGAEYLLQLRRGEHPSHARPKELMPDWTLLGAYE